MKRAIVWSLCISAIGTVLLAIGLEINSVIEEREQLRARVLRLERLAEDVLLHRVHEICDVDMEYMEVSTQWLWDMQDRRDSGMSREKAEEIFMEVCYKSGLEDSGPSIQCWLCSVVIADYCYK